ncbi:MAG: plasmid recombination protein, partial [Paludibacteraceae bacterium]|nr:plasmid recombination protein [Paludibacteraceae bacterium]
MAQGFEVFRMEKLKTEGAIVRSLRHDLDLSYENEQGETVYYRKTRNEELAKQNQYMWRAENQEQKFQIAMKNWREKLPEKIRNNAVLGAQCIMSFSHELLENKFDYIKYFQDCQKFVNEHFGKENVFNWALHVDEKTPHITFQFLPKDENGKLNARKIFGNKKTLSEWQTKFHEEVGQKYGLQRGIKKTNLIHETLNAFYGKLKNLDEDLEKLPLEKKEMFESWDEYLARQKKILKTFVEPMLKPLASLRSQVAKLEKRIENFETEKADFQTLKKSENKALEERRSVLERAERDFQEKVQEAVEERLETLIPQIREQLENAYIPKSMKFNKGEKSIDFNKMTYKQLAEDLASFYLDDEPTVHKRKREIEREFERNRVRT